MDWQKMIIVCVLALFGFVLGMDKAHDWRDFCGPLLMYVAVGIGVWHGIYYVSGFIAIIATFKILSR